MADPRQPTFGAPLPRVRDPRQPQAATARVVAAELGLVTPPRTEQVATRAQTRNTMSASAVLFANGDDETSVLGGTRRRGMAAKALLG